MFHGTLMKGETRGSNIDSFDRHRGLLTGFAGDLVHCACLTTVLVPSDIAFQLKLASLTLAKPDLLLKTGGDLLPTLFHTFEECQQKKCSF